MPEIKLALLVPLGFSLAVGVMLLVRGMLRMERRDAFRVFIVLTWVAFAAGPVIIYLLR